MTAPLTTDRLILRGRRLEDADAIAEQLNDWDVVRWLARVPYPYNIGDARYWIETGLREESADEHLVRLITNKTTGAYMGTVSMHRRTEGGPLELGYWLGRAHWGQGYVTEAARVLVDHAFQAPETDRILSGHFAGNHGSRNVLVKLGFRQVDTGPFWCPARARYLEHCDMLLTREDWSTI